jgi:hypothetical protein
MQETNPKKLYESPFHYQPEYRCTRHRQSPKLVDKWNGRTRPPANSFKDKQQDSDPLEAICNPEKYIKSAELFPKSVQASHFFELVNLLRPKPKNKI